MTEPGKTLIGVDGFEPAASSPPGQGCTAGSSSMAAHRGACAMLDAVTPRATRRLTEGVQMVAGATPQHGYIGGESERLSNADLSERDRHSEEDHSAHAAGKICKSCGRPIEAEQPARRRGETDWAHDVCPVITD